MSYKYMGDFRIDEVVIKIQKEEHAFIIQLFRAHTSEPYGELQIPKAHAGVLSKLLLEYATENQKGTQTTKEDSGSNP